MIAESIAAVIGAYLLGSIPFAYIAGRWLNDSCKHKKSGRIRIILNCIGTLKIK